MNADPDALRRAADEMDALIARQAAHLVDIERLEEERADALRCLGVAQRARDGFGSKLDRIADLVYPLGLRLHGDDVEAVVARVVRRLAGAEAERDALLAADAPMIAKLIDILGDACLPSEIAGRVRDLARRLEAAELDRAGLVATTDALRRERDGAITQMDRLDKRLGLVASQLERAEAERDEARDELAKLRATGPATGWWKESQFIVDGDCAYSAYDMGAANKSCVIRWSDKKYVGYATSLDSARRLAELLAGFDPGGIWRVAGEPVTVAVVKAVCPTVAVSWGPA